MVKLVALYRKPSDVQAFDDHYFKIHLPLIRKLPGLKQFEVSKVTGAPIGESKYHLIAEMYFEDQDALDAAMASPEGRASAKDLMSFAADVVTLFHTEVLD
jgi:uncharacterized protein (TIGR02118 family)